MTAATQPKFENRVRFNWGYHDASQCVREGWNTIERNYGFGSALNITDPDQVNEQHYDKAYAMGWTFGYYEAIGGGTCETSEYAWESAKRQGKVE